MGWMMISPADDAAARVTESENIAEGVSERTVHSVFLAASTGSINMGFCWSFMNDFRGRL